jgi:hypothetical protein
MESWQIIGLILMVVISLALMFLTELFYPMDKTTKQSNWRFNAHFKNKTTSRRSSIRTRPIAISSDTKKNTIEWYLSPILWLGAPLVILIPIFLVIISN